MTKKQIKQLDEVLMLLPDNHPSKRKELQRNRARSMANSCICYSDDKSFYDEDTKALGKSALEYIKDGITADDLVNVYFEQKEEIAKGEIMNNVYTDHEGCSYNSINWWDEKDNTPADKVREHARQHFMEEARYLLKKTQETAVAAFNTEKFRDRSQYICVVVALSLYVKEKRLEKFPDDDWAIKFREELDEMVNYLEDKQEAA